MRIGQPFQLEAGGPFSYHDGILHAGGLSVDELAAAAGTPLYLYVLDEVETAYRRLQTALRPDRVLYSVKANGNLALLRRLAAIGAGFDVVSGGELLRVLRAGGRPDRIVFAGVGKTREELGFAVRCGVVLHVESADELAALQGASARLGARARFGLRVNPDVEAGFHPYLRTGHDEAKFGLPARTAVEPGRALVARAGALVAKVLAVKPRPGGRAVGFLHFVPWGKDGASLDVVRRDRDGPGYLNDFLVVEAARRLPELGVRRLSLNFSFLRAVLAAGAEPRVPLSLRAGRWLLRRLSGPFQIEALYRFNEKFAPAWQPRYLAVETPEELPRVVVAVLRAEGLLPVLPWRFLRQRHQAAGREEGLPKPPPGPRTPMPDRK